MYMYLVVIIEIKRENFISSYERKEYKLYCFNVEEVYVKEIIKVKKVMVKEWL